MKFTPAVLAALIGLVAAQDLSSIPACAKPCIDDAITSGTKCTITDLPCICKSIEAVTAGATACVLSACGADVAIGQVLPATAKLCADVAPVAGSSSTGSSSTTALGPFPVPSSSTTVPASTTKRDSEPANSDGATASTTPTGTPAAGASKSSSTSSSSTAGAASFGAVGSLGMLFLGAVAAL